jgi:hypothetical protein
MPDFRFVLVAAELSPDEGDERRRGLFPEVLSTMGNSCRVMSMCWVVRTTMSTQSVYRQIASSEAIGEHDRLIVVPVADPEPGEEPWWTQNAPNALKCFKM